MLSIIATLPIRADKTDEFERAFRALAEQVLANEKGCLRYELCRSTVQPATYVVVERYADQQAFDAHAQTPYFREFFAQSRDFLAGAPQIDILKPAV